MRRFLAFVLALLFGTSSAFAAVAYVGIVGLTGSTPATTGSYSPTGGNQLICINSGLHTSTVGTSSWSGSATTLTALSVSSATNWTDGVSSVYSVYYSLSATAGAQTFTLASSPSGLFINTNAPCLEYSGAMAIKNATYKVVDCSSTCGTGGIAGNAITVASTDKLLVTVVDATNFFATAATVNSPSGSASRLSYSSELIADWTGTGGSMTPTFTPDASANTDTYMVVQMDVSSTGSGGGGSQGQGGFAGSPSN